jgi:hypothetical protein
LISGSEINTEVEVIRRVAITGGAKQLTASPKTREQDLARVL